MEISAGLFEHMVLQRNNKDESEAGFSGNSEKDGSLFAQVNSAGRILRGWSMMRVGKALGGRLTGRLSGIPAGGPYDVTLFLKDNSGKKLDEICIRDVMVGDVWLLGGQSNMQGCGLLAGRPAGNPAVRAFYMNDRWDVARDPLHDMSEVVDQVHIDLSGGVRPGRNNTRGAGPGVSFGQEMYKRTGIPQGLIACAHGGTSMSQWDPVLKEKGSKSLYGAMIRRLVKNGGRVAGLVWYQGESDAGDIGTASLYMQRMKVFVETLRRDAGNSLLPVAVVQIGRVIGWGASESWLSVQDQQRRLPEIISNCTVVPAIDLPLDDCIHISGKGQIVLGKRLAEAMDVLMRGKAAGSAPISLRRIKQERAADTGLTNVVVDFDNVVGHLVADGRPVGFSVYGPNNKAEQAFDVVLKGSSVIIRTGLSAVAARFVSVVHGPDTNPCCNIHDTAGRPLPVFGPIRLGSPMARTDYVRELKVSMFHPSSGRLDGLKYPRINAMKWTMKKFAGDFCDLHSDIGALAPNDMLLYYACRLECLEDMKLSILLGYDGPVKVWADGRAVFHDPNGTNPAVPDEKAIPFHASRGSHEIVVALGTNNGKAWGIFLAFERRDVRAELIAKGRDYYTLPRLIG